MATLAIVDTGPIYAAVDRDDRWHRASVEAMQRPEVRLVFPTMAIAEATYLIGTRIGPDVESRFLSSLVSCEVEAPHPDEWKRIAELCEAYADFPLGGTDASVVSLAERLDTDLIITLDRRHFSAVKPIHCDGFRLLP